MKGPRCTKHTHRHYQVNDCDACKKEKIDTLTERLQDAEAIITALATTYQIHGKHTPHLEAIEALRKEYEKKWGKHE